MFRILKSLNVFERLYIVTCLLVYLCYNLYNIWYYPVYIDEALTYNYFTCKDIIISATYYPFPNNHILFSILSNFFSNLTFDPLINLRLPNIILGGMLLLLLYIYLKNKFDKVFIILPHIIFVFSYGFTFYSVFARGYMLTVFFTVVCLLAIDFWSKSSNKKYLIIYVIASVLGFYAIPIYLYVTASFALFLLITNYKNKVALIQIIQYHTFIVLGVFILYAPIVYYNGLDSIINNEFTQKLSLSHVFDFLSKHAIDVYDKLLGIRSRYIIIVFIITLIILFKKTKDKQQKELLTFVLVFFLLPSVFMLAQSVIPGIRTWTYLMVPFCIGIAAILNYINDYYIKFNAIVFGVISLFALLGNVYVFKKSHPLSALGKDYESAVLSNVLLQSDCKSVFFECNNREFEYVNFEYYVKSRNLKVNLKSETDSLNPNYINHFDCLVVYDKNMINKSYKLLYTNNSVYVYGRVKRL